MLVFLSKQICNYPFPIPLQIWSPSHRRWNCKVAEADWVVKSHGPDSHRPHVGPQGVKNSRPHGRHFMSFVNIVFKKLHNCLQEALEWGLANRVCSSGTAYGQAVNLAKEIVKFPQVQ